MRYYINDETGVLTPESENGDGNWLMSYVRGLVLFEMRRNPWEEGPLAAWQTVGIPLEILYAIKEKVKVMMTQSRDGSDANVELYFKKWTKDQKQSGIFFPKEAELNACGFLLAGVKSGTLYAVRKSLDLDGQVEVIIWTFDGKRRRSITLKPEALENVLSTIRIEVMGS